jgi:hypothetical protein
MSLQSDAQNILNALCTSGRTDVPPADHPGLCPAADQPASSHARYEKALDAYHAHLNNLPASAFADFPSDSAETRAKKAAMRKDLFAAATSAMGLK